MASHHTQNLPGKEATNDAAISPLSSVNDIDHCKTILSTMLRKEAHYVSVPYLRVTKDTNKNVNAALLDVSCRTKICRWMFHTIDNLRFQRETAIIGMSYLDRFMSLSVPLAKRARYNRRAYQLVAMSSLYIAVKITEPQTLSVSMISALSRGVYSVNDIVACEKAILTSLRWKVNGPTPVQFINYFLQLLPAAEDSSVVSKLFATSCSEVELATLDYACIPLRSSTVATAAILNSLEDVPQDVLSIDGKNQFIQEISNVIDIDVEESRLIKVCRQRLLDLSAKSSRPKARHQVVTPLLLPTEGEGETQAVVATEFSSESSLESSPVCASIEISP